MKNYYRVAGVVLLHLAAIFALVSVDLDANGQHAEASPWSAIAITVVAFGFLRLQEAERDRT